LLLYWFPENLNFFIKKNQNVYYPEGRHASIDADAEIQANVAYGDAKIKFTKVNLQKCGR